eukprot:gnl/TRDRNA2_/TRDRNA2_86295_c0_seq1.p1 gnl/TRDRNA2_/TRDRNA2_86295_c0~~gnl/TRDRNA2_/TRDRNA2_86295_c0_seq1.p1  ORF type:complete len:740 (-),score=125.61 gnl/TRDRNA2_/TRDRNA2_86295_c0_seq1:108-2261(-)
MAALPANGPRDDKAAHVLGSALYDKSEVQEARDQNVCMMQVKSFVHAQLDKLQTFVEQQLACQEERLLQRLESEIKEQRSLMLALRGELEEDRCADQDRLSQRLDSNLAELGRNVGNLKEAITSRPADDAGAEQAVYPVSLSITDLRRDLDNHKDMIAVTSSQVDQQAVDLDAALAALRRDLTAAQALEAQSLREQYDMSTADLWQGIQAMRSRMEAFTSATKSQLEKEVAELRSALKVCPAPSGLPTLDDTSVTTRSTTKDDDGSTAELSDLQASLLETREQVKSFRSTVDAAVDDTRRAMVREVVELRNELEEGNTVIARLSKDLDDERRERCGALADIGERIHGIGGAVSALSKQLAEQVENEADLSGESARRKAGEEVLQMAKRAETASDAATRGVASLGAAVSKLRGEVESISKELVVGGTVSSPNMKVLVDARAKTTPLGSRSSSASRVTQPVVAGRDISIGAARSSSRTRLAVESPASTDRAGGQSPDGSNATSSVPHARGRMQAKDKEVKEEWPAISRELKERLEGLMAQVTRTIGADALAEIETAANGEHGDRKQLSSSESSSRVAPESPMPITRAQSASQPRLSTVSIGTSSTVLISPATSSRGHPVNPAQLSSSPLRTHVERSQSPMVRPISGYAMPVASTTPLPSPLPSLVPAPSLTSLPTVGSPGRRLENRLYPRQQSAPMLTTSGPLWHMGQQRGSGSGPWPV